MDYDPLLEYIEATKVRIICRTTLLRYHSCDGFPYVGIRSDNQVSAWHDLSSGVLSVVSFREFQSVIQEDHVMELYAAELGDIL